MTISKASLSKIQYTTPIDDLPDGPTLSASNVGTSRAFNNGSATVTATAAATGGGNITSYTVTSSPGGYTASGSSPLTVTGLQSNTSYTFTATATNAKGTSPFSGPASDAITATTVPDAPTIGTASVTSETVVSLTFTPPASGGSNITSYVIEASPSLGITTQAGTTSPLTATATYVGQQNYTFTIKAVNANGTSDASSSSNSIQPKTTSDLAANFLVVAGGGASEPHDNGGGGAGGLRSSFGTTGGGGSLESAISITPGTNYTVTVGAGGAAGQCTGHGAFTETTNGSNSVFSSVTSVGGGRSNNNGGSGGGSNGTTPGLGTANQGYDGARNNPTQQSNYGGGGGAGSAGQSGSSSVAGQGGAGVSVSITGSSVTYASGGGGGCDCRNNGSSPGQAQAGGGQNGTTNEGIPTAATANTGGGAGGPGGFYSYPLRPGANGGSGVVVLRWPTANGTISVGAGLTADATGTDGSFSYKRFTAGTGNVSWT